MEVENTSLCNLDNLLDVAVESGYIRQSDKIKLLTFRDNPSDESWMEK